MARVQVREEVVAPRCCVPNLYFVFKRRGERVSERPCKKSPTRLPARSTPVKTCSPTTKKTTATILPTAPLHCPSPSAPISAPTFRLAHAAGPPLRRRLREQLRRHGVGRRQRPQRHRRRRRGRRRRRRSRGRAEQGSFSLAFDDGERRLRRVGAPLVFKAQRRQEVHRPQVADGRRTHGLRLAAQEGQG